MLKLKNAPRNLSLSFSLCRTEIIWRFLLDKLPGAEIVLLALFHRKSIPAPNHLLPSHFTTAINTVNAQYKWVCFGLLSLSVQTLYA